MRAAHFLLIFFVCILTCNSLSAQALSDNLSAQAVIDSLLAQALSDSAETRDRQEYGSHWSGWIVKPDVIFTTPEDYWFLDNVDLNSHVIIELDKSNDIADDNWFYCIAYGSWDDPYRWSALLGTTWCSFFGITYSFFLSQLISIILISLSSFLQ
ncbi:MAG: hypothetical protein K8R90_02110 [Candidatus Cloacimonetes bacterium]|nr:hypothetical protein [Candidatus Cloacimonadota bacterium]